MERDQIFNYRQPMVTASGIILGFVLNFATGLVKREYKSDLIVILILISTLIGIVCLIISLFRILNHQYDRENSAKYYSKTLKFFISGVIFSFSAGLIKMLHTLSPTSRAVTADRPCLRHTSRPGSPAAVHGSY